MALENVTEFESRNLGPSTNRPHYQQTAWQAIVWLHLWVLESMPAWKQLEARQLEHYSEGQNRPAGRGCDKLSRYAV